MSATSKKTKKWTTEESIKLYGIDRWGADYFSVDEHGDIVICPNGTEEEPRVSLPKIVKGMLDRGMNMPVLLRIENILGSQIKRLHETFAKAIKNLDYNGSYKGVFPLKVNQRAQVVEAISQFGRKFDYGLEAASKPELIAAISILENRNACLICNGYKDAEFIDLGLYATKMGLQCFFVIEIPGELDLILERAALIGVRPKLGLRIKLAAKAEGKWAESGGDSSVFGLNMSQIIHIVDRLKNENKLDCLCLLHHHLGSQISNISDIRVGVMEACRIYEELAREGAAMGYLDLGGGLAVDYDGSRTNEPSSRNYTLDEYCNDIVETIATVLDKSDTPHPTIITESGRATVACYSILLFNVIDVSSYTPHPIPRKLPETSNDLLENLLYAYNMVSPTDIQECYNDTFFYRDQARQLFKHGHISLRERAIAEDLFRHIMIKIAKTTAKSEHLPREIQKINDVLSDVYYGNFSVFQSLPDVWAINQLFPVSPIHRLNEEPSRPAIIADITCDSDGKIDLFSNSHGAQKTIMLHGLKENEEYYLGVFLVGAYQETLGNLHNLFGDTNVVSINIHNDGSYDFVSELEGDSVADILSYVDYDLKVIKQRIKKFAEDSIHKGFIKAKDRKVILRMFDKGLRGYSYFEGK